MSKEYTVEPIEEKSEECQTCKKGYSNVQKGMLLLSIYILISSIYGTVQLFKLFSSLF